MLLSEFISDLIEKGHVTIAGEMLPFAEQDRIQALAKLQEYYNREVLEMPGQAPAFLPEAAMWAAEYLYRTIQFTLLRDLDETAIGKVLTQYPGSMSAEAVFSADLCLRYLPGVLSLAAGLAPNDPLIVHLKSQVSAWPFSSVNMDIPESPEMDAAEEIILAHPSLRIAYADRIIAAKKLKRVRNEEIAESVREALGEYAEALWPEFSAGYGVSGLMESVQAGVKIP